MTQADVSAMSLSIVLYVHNGGEYLPTMLDSVLDQSYCDFELCVVDDGSTDQTPEVLRSAAADDSRVRVQRQEPHGSDRLHDTFNNGLAMTRHDLIAVANADDIWLPDKLRTQVAAFEADDALDVCFHDATFIDTAGRVLHGSFRTVPSPLACLPPKPWHFVSGNPIPNPTAMFHRSVLRRIGLQELGQMHDHQFWFKATVHGCRFLGLPQRLIKYRVHEASESTATHKRERIRSKHRECIEMMTERYGLDQIFPELGLTNGDLESTAWAWTYLGAVLWEGKALDRAASAWTEAVRLSDNPAPVFNLALGYHADRDRHRARQLFTTAAGAGIQDAHALLESPEMAAEAEPCIWHGPPPAIADLIDQSGRGELEPMRPTRTGVPDTFMVVRESDSSDAIVAALVDTVHRHGATTSLLAVASADSAMAAFVDAYQTLEADPSHLGEGLVVDLIGSSPAEAESIAAAHELEGVVRIPVGATGTSSVRKPKRSGVLLPV